MYSESRPWKINHEKVFNILNNIIKDPIYGAEIGVAYAGNSFNLLNKFKNLNLYSIDPYVKYSDEDKTSDSVEGENGNILYKIVSNTLKENFKERSFFIRANSNCLIDFQDEFFDFIFIDGDHSYEGVKRDFDLYKKLLSPRGYIAFHDIDPNHVFLNSYSNGESKTGKVRRFWQELNYGSKIEIICTKSNGKGYLSYDKNVKQNFGGIGIWKP